MKQIEKNISHFIEKQFPAYYREQYPALTAFIRAYYEFLEGNDVELEQPLLLEEDQTITELTTEDELDLVGEHIDPDYRALYQARKLFDYRDIDSTLAQFVTYFSNKYVVGIDDSILCCKRFLIKHILDLYRAKGTPRAYELLFRILYDEDINLYIPGSDILRVSDGTWKQQRYIELTDNTIAPTFEKRQIYGFSSNATATVESYERITLDNRTINVAYIANIKGLFKIGEHVNIVGNTSTTGAPKVKGSLENIVIDSGGENFTIGDNLAISGRGAYGRSRAASVRTTGGTLSFTLVEGGNGYQSNATVSVAGGGGVDGSFDVIITNTGVVTVFEDTIEPYLTVDLANSDFGFPRAGSETISTAIEDALTKTQITVGTIVGITNINPGSEYSGIPAVSVTQPNIIELGIGDLGNNAIIAAEVVPTSNSISAVGVYNSGFGYLNGERVALTSDQGSSTAYGYAVLGPIGRGEGYWTSSRGFVSADKYVQDSEYYQEFSYDIKSKLDLTVYEQVVRDLLHPAGFAMYGSFDYDNTQEVGIDVAHYPILSEASLNILTETGGFELEKTVGAVSQDTINYPIVVGSKIANTLQGAYGPVPENMHEGDILFVVTAADNHDQEVPTGFTEIAQYDTGAGGAPDSAFSYRVQADVIDTNTVGHVSVANSALQAAFMSFAVRYGSASAIGSFQQANGSPGMPTSPPITTTSSNSMVVIVGMLDDDQVTDVTAPSGFTLINSSICGSGQDATVMAAYKIVEAANTVVTPDPFGGSGTDAWFAVSVEIIFDTTYLS